MTRLMTTCAMTLALAAPAWADGHAKTSGAMAEDVSEQATVRYIRRDADGNVVFDSMAADQAPGATGAVADAIARADGPTVGATDDAVTRSVAAGEGLPSDGMTPQVSAGALTEAEQAGGLPQETAEAMTAEGAGGLADSFTAEMAAQAVPATDQLDAGGQAQGGYGLTGSPDIASAGGVDSVPFDVEAFATEMFEQGYRKGYVRAMTEVRAEGIRRMQQRIQAGQFQDRERFRQQAQDTRRGMTRDVLTFRDAQGNQMRFVLPEGMSRAEFLRQIDQ
ncbi:hypothetical protein JQC91_14320 [Jannaschia sp. Os4]|uniref:hypothetical protein n=1 Tax=Jannaschia sp. Os4 TaxID=2807617 RepID=UPI00193A567F|nr:hypothetical protein [Jannaschia sp. Os4]MBM2577479.1 hypothetical protein [Jannaschia sp. Os4]